MNVHEARLKRRVGMSPKRRAYVNQKLLAAQDWQINCHSCGERMVGSIESLDKHRRECDGQEGN